MEETNRLSDARILLPSEWCPTQWDVPEANQVPDRDFVQRFKVALSHSEEGKYCKLLLPDTDDANDAHPGTPFLQRELPAGEVTYPLSLLSDLFDTSGYDDVILHLQGSFCEIFQHHVYLNGLGSSNFAWYNNPSAAPLEYAQACLCCVVSRNAADAIHQDNPDLPVSLAATLFELGVRLWIVTVELDNREARKDESFLAVSGKL